MKTYIYIFTIIASLICLNASAQNTETESSSISSYSDVMETLISDQQDAQAKNKDKVVRSTFVMYESELIEVKVPVSIKEKKEYTDPHAEQAGNTLNE